MSATAATLNLLDVVGTAMKAGMWLNTTTASFPTTVLRSVAADRLAVSKPGTIVRIGERNIIVVGVLHQGPLTTELDYTALIGCVCQFD